MYTIINDVQYIIMSAGWYSAGNGANTVHLKF